MSTILIHCRNQRDPCVTANDHFSTPFHARPWMRSWVVNSL